ncbi:putative HAF family extracellular repeat protein [Agromyces sp. 3263]|uniref:S8 family serine peptidase n=1 Tax=Agromyces sp. 3263 TaxID=2817750 RepID=UPI00285FB504|nr:S8 family serine peptidase [Agromyces sp. 3263]MDR6907753.1 putative HAF family extracellular repeat protein [Agromyces sp. 3263]
MSTRRKLVGAASAALISAAMMMAPIGTAAASPAAPPDRGSSTTPDPNGPFAAGRPGAVGPRDGSAGIDTRSAGDPGLYDPAADPGFHPLDSTGSSDDAAEKLGAADTRLLQQAQVDETDTVTVMILARKGAADEVVAAVRKAGGTVGSVTEKLGYVRATVPTDRVSDLAGRSDVKAIDLNRTYRVPAPGTGAEVALQPSSFEAGPSAPDATTPAANPYLPIGETGAAEFVAAHPEWDGRGTVVGVLDTGVDVGHPALQTTSDGKPKIIDWVTATDPIQDGDGSWIEMTTEKTGPSFRSGGAEWTAPAGDFRFARFYEYATSGSDFGGDLDRNGDIWDSFGVLYEPSTHKIWVDADNDQDFTDAPAMSPYGIDRSVGHFGADDPSTAENEEVPFVVEYRDDVDLTPLGDGRDGQTGTFVNIGLPAAAHGTHVAGIVAATSMFGGEMHGAAPGAQIVSSRACTFQGGCTQAALTEGMIDLVMNRGVDVVNLSIGGLPALNDGSDVIADLYDQLIDAYGVQIIVAAGNDGLGTNTVSSPSVAGKAISVAASVSSSTWWADYGARVTAEQGIFGFSSRGPAEDGGLAPQLSAPGAAVSTIPMWLSGQAVPETGYALPAGYGMFNGTSMAAPQVAGSAALLLSAAKAGTVPVSPAALKTALTGTARQIAGVPTTAQGAGIIDTVAAWKQLAKKVAVNALDVAAPVCSSLSHLLETPHTGPGAYNRCLPGEGGQLTGEEQTYKVAVTRTSGAAGNVVHRIGWIGNDGTFNARGSLPLKKDKAATVTVTANAATSGLHSAIMTIDDPATVGIDEFVSVAVLATTPLERPDFAVTGSGTLPRGGSTSLLVPVPEGVEALQMTLDGVADGSQVRILPIDPDGMPADSNASDHCYTASTDPSGCDAAARAVYRPKAGIWEFVIEARRTSGTDANSYTAAVSLQGMSVEPGSTTLDSVTMNEPTDVSMAGTNTFAPVDAHVTTGEVGTVANLFSTVAQGEVTANQLYVPRETTRLDVTLTPREEADLDFFVYFAGSPIGQGTATADSPARIVVDDPQPGTYYIVVAGVSVAGDGVTFDYHQEMYSKGQGTVTPKSDATYGLSSGESMPVDGALIVTARQLTGEPMVGRVRVANEYGTIIGAASVAVTTVDVPQLDVVSWAPPFVGAGLTDDGVVAGDRQYEARMTPTTWTADGGFVNLEVQEDGYGSALGINEEHTAVGVVTGDDGGFIPAQWSADGSLTRIGTPDWRSYSGGYATGVNDEGIAIGFAELTEQDSDGLWHAYSDGFSRTSDGTFHKLDHLSTSTSGTQPRAINGAGTVVGQSLDADHAPRAVRWDAATGAVSDLGTLPGQSSAVALDVNASGTVVGVSGDDAFVWSEAGGMTRLADYGYDAAAEKVSDDGWVLGSIELAPYFPVSAMWDPQGRLWDLSGMVPVAEGDWFLATYGFDLNDVHQLMLYGEGGPEGAPSSSVLLSIPAALRD